MKTPNYLLIFISILILSFSSATAQTFDGYALYNLQNSNTTYLIDKDYNIAHSWSLALTGNYTVHLKENGNLVRGGTYGSNVLSAPAVSGIIQEFDPSGNLVWEFIYSDATHVSHHDFCVLPNGNVILTAYEVKTPNDLTQAGYDGATSNLWPTHFIEVEQNGSGGQIVWEWHMWDHLVQDFDAGKDNYGVVANSPELMDINAISPGFGPPGSGDWFHINGIDYNPTLDQLVFTSRYASEFYIIDHSTTTAEAASHLGGNAGMGGDFLYRYGNPPNHGSTSPQIIPSAVHDPRWIKAGRPNAGFIQFFNNNGGGGSSSTIDAIDPPLSGFNYTSYTTPTTYDWRHNTNAYSSGQSAHDRMTNGNTFVNVSGQYMYEVDASNNVVWQYAAGPSKAFRFECDYAGIIALLGNNPCGLTGIEEFSDLNINVFPNPSKGIFNVTGISDNINSFSVSVYDVYGKLVMQANNEIRIDLTSFDNGVYIVYISNNVGETIVKKISLIK
ncbi:MAG: aryl-sulfate sulfotransferase [Flavobacteriales bacterium]|nr:aryl-sulfate sulfotransferase [Flavobacteriales bacterium]